MAPDDAGDPTGERTEHRVRSLYIALGYDVRTDRMVEGSQADLVAEKTVRGTGRVRLLVEVKHLQTGSVPKQQVIDFCNLVRNAQAAGAIDRGVLVTNRTFTRQSKEVVGNAPVELLTIEELTDQVVPVAEALQRTVIRYRSMQISDRYIDLTAQRSGYGGTSPKVRTQQVRASELLVAAKQHPNCALLLFADYGAGKTTTIERIHHAAAIERLANGRAPVPILFRLKDLGLSEDIDGYIAESVRNDLGSEFGADLFWELADAGELLLLLDGFDEISLQVDRSGRAELLRRISPLLFGPSAAIMTSRPSYFIDNHEYIAALNDLRTAGGFIKTSTTSTPPQRRLARAAELLALADAPRSLRRSQDPNWITFDLQSLTSEQIDEYLATYETEFADVGTSPAAVREFVDRVYHLGDLVTRPIILHMVTTLVENRQLTITKDTSTFGAAELYTLYTRQRITRDIQNVASRREVLDGEQRWQFAEVAAAHMQTNSILEVPADDLRELVRASGVSLAEHELDHALTDLRTCSFLTVGDEGHLRFIHRSFQEFFLAARICRGVREQTYTDLDTPLPPNVAYFLGSFATNDDELRNRFHELTRTPQTINRAERAQIASNLATAYLYSRDHARDLSWSDHHLGRVAQPNLVIGRSKLDNVKFTELAIGNVRIENCEQMAATLTADSDELAITSCTGRLTLKGRSDSIAIRGGDVRIDDWSTGTSIDIESATVRRNARSGGRKTIRASQAILNVELTEGDSVELHATRATILQQSNKVWELNSTASIVQLAADDFGRAHGDLKDTIIRLTPSTMQGSRRTGFRDRLRVNGVVLLCPAGADPHWGGTDANELLILGGRWQGKNRDATWRGLMFQPSRSASAKNFARCEQLADDRLILTGVGPLWTSLLEAFDKLLASATTGPINADGGFGPRLRACLTGHAIDPEPVEPVITAAALTAAAATGPI